MHPADLQFLAGFFKRRSGLAFGADKAALGESRLMPVARRYGLRTIEDLVVALKAGEEPLATEATQAMTVNDTAFFRDKPLFEALREEILPALMRARRTTRKLRIWSAACASGEEPYSFAMMLSEMGEEVADWSFEIFATDLSAEMIAMARDGFYEAPGLQKHVPQALIARHFERSDGLWRISENLRDMVKFQQFNLLHDFSGFGRFDLVLCRNVLFYFDPAARRDVMERVSDSLSADGYLALGAAETMLGFHHLFQRVPEITGVHRRRDRAHVIRGAATA
jgi:chemotaxis protein methyltransferase CheR